MKIPHLETRSAPENAGVLAELQKAFGEHGDTVTNMAESLASMKTQLGSFKAELNRLVVDNNKRKLPFVGGKSSNMALNEQLDSLASYLRSGQMKDANISSNPAGGFIVSSELDTSIQDMLISISPMRQIARVVSVTNVGDFSIPIGRRGATSVWVAEKDSRQVTDTPQLGLATPAGGELESYAEVTQWLLDDAAFNVESWLTENILDEHAQKEGIAFVSGDGNKKPTGFLSGTPVATADAARAFGTLQYVPTGVSGDFAASNKGDILINLVYTLTAPYRKGARWLMNSNAAKSIRLFKDGQGNYLWQPASVAGQPDSLLGYPVTIDESMPDIAANSLSIAFGNFQRGYVIVDKVGPRILRDPFTKPGWIRLYHYRRVHGGLTDSNAIKLLKFSVS